MQLLAETFPVFASVALVSLLILAVGWLMLRFLHQPIERVRCIQTAFAACLLALVLRHVILLPKISLAILPSIAPVTVPANTPSATAHPVTIGDTLIREPAVQPTGIVPDEVSAEESGEVALIPPASDRTTALSLSHLASTALVFQSAVVAIATIGVWYWLLVLLAGHWQLRRLRARSQALASHWLEEWRDVELARSNGVSILTSSRLHVPLTFGVRRPAIILPAHMVLPTALAAPSDRQSVHYCLSHELAHIIGRDNFTWTLVQWLQPLLWFQPLYWVLRGELRMAQDQLADAFATGHEADRLAYADLLLQLGGQSASRTTRLALTMATGRSKLYQRIELLLNDSFHVARGSRWRVTLSLACVLLSAMLAFGFLEVERAIAQPVGDTLPAEEESQAQQPHADAVELSYSGQVLDKQTGKPIAGAKVVVRRSILASFDRRLIEETEHTTDDSGTYHFTIPPEQTSERYLYIELDVEHPEYAWRKGFGYGLSMIRKNETLGEAPFFSKIELHPADTITGRVVNPDGQPVAGAFVQAYSKTSAQDWSDYGSFFQTKSDSDGRFRLQLVQGGPSVFWIVSEDYSPKQIVSDTKRGDLGDIAVASGVRIRGKVLNATGDPVPNVWVNLDDPTARDDVSLPVATYVTRSAKTDADGTFTLRPMKPGSYRINVAEHGSELTDSKQGWADVVKVEDVFVAKQIDIGPADEDRLLTVQALPYVEFHAQYRDGQGKPTRGHEVMIYGQFEGQWFHTQLPPDKNGKIVGRLPHGLSSARMDAITNEHGAIQVRLRSGEPLRAGRDLELGTIEDDINGVEIIRYTAPIVQIKPVDEQGNIVKDCKIAGVYTDGRDDTVYPVGGAPTNIHFEHQQDGRHRTSQMIPDREVEFTVTAEGFQDASEKIALPEGEERELVLVLKQKA